MSIHVILMDVTGVHASFPFLLPLHHLTIVTGVHDKVSISFVNAWHQLLYTDPQAVVVHQAILHIVT